MKHLIVFSIIFLTTLSCGDLTNSEKTLSQSDIDKYTGYAIIDAVGQTYNINFAGKPVGGQNLETTCPMGGIVKITGSTGYSQNNGITTVELTFVMTDCKSDKHTPNNIDTSFTFNGTILWKGSFNSSTGYDATNYQSESLKMKGTITVPNFKKTEVDQSCKFAATITNKTVAGNVCDRKFSY